VQGGFLVKHKADGLGFGEKARWGKVTTRMNEVLYSLTVIRPEGSMRSWAVE